MVHRAAADRIERAAPTGHPEGFTVPTPGSRPTGIVAAPGGFLWVTMEGTGQIAKVDPAGPSSKRPRSRRAADGDRTRPDSALWAIERGIGDRCAGREGGQSLLLPAAHQRRLFRARLDSDIVTGPDGNLWLAQADGPSSPR